MQTSFKIFINAMGVAGFVIYRVFDIASNSFVYCVLVGSFLLFVFYNRRYRKMCLIINLKQIILLFLILPKLLTKSDNRLAKAKMPVIEKYKTAFFIFPIMLICSYISKLFIFAFYFRLVADRCEYIDQLSFVIADLLAIHLMLVVLSCILALFIDSLRKIPNLFIWG